jgi:hypothetical protein
VTVTAVGPAPAPRTAVPAGPAGETAPGGAAGEAGTAGEAGAGDTAGAGTPPAPTALRVNLDPAEDVAVAPGSVLELTSPVALVDVRFRVFDEDNRLLPSRTRITVGAGTQVQITPEAPLPGGSAFRLEITGQLQQYPTGVDGKHFGGRTFRFHTTGEKPEPPPPPKPQRRRR